MNAVQRALARLAASAVLAGVLFATITPVRPSARLPTEGALAGGTLAGLVLYLVVARRRPAGPTGITTPLAAASCVVLAIAAAGEEVIWRRVVLGELLRSGPVLALMGSSLGFGLAHRARPRLHLGTGAVFGGVYLATGALGACIAAHWVYNVLLLWLSGRERVVAGASP